MNTDSTLRKHRLERRLSLEEVSGRTGISVSQISRMERGQRNATLPDLLALAGVYQVPVGSLIDTTPVLVVGCVGAGAEAIIFSEGQGPLEEVDRPPGAGASTVAVVVRGDSMSGAADDNWLLYYDDVRNPPTTDLFGHLCVVGLIDGRILVKKLLPGRKANRFDLYSTNAAPIQDEELAWAAKVEWIKPR